MRKNSTLTDEQIRIEEKLFWQKVGVIGNIVVSVICFIAISVLFYFLNKWIGETGWMYQLMNQGMTTIKNVATVVISVAASVGAILALTWLSIICIKKLIRFYLRQKEANV